MSTGGIWLAFVTHAITFVVAFTCGRMSSQSARPGAGPPFRQIPPHMPEPMPTHPPAAPAPDCEQAVIARILERQRLGVAKYGTTVADSRESHDAFLRHAQDEALDLAIYLERVRQDRSPTAEPRFPDNWIIREGSDANLADPWARSRVSQW